jgi:hypothetical protein
MKTIFSLITSFSLLFLTAPCGWTDPVLVNLDQNFSQSKTIGNGGVYGAIQFFTGSLAPAWKLDAVTLVFGGPSQWGANNYGPILYNAYIYNGAGNTPTSQLGFLGSFNYTDEVAGISQETFNPTSEISLTSNSEYWIVVGAVTDCPGGQLEGTGSGYNDIPGNGWSYGEFCYYWDGGPAVNGGGGMPFLEIQATAEPVPEPFSLAMVGLGAVTLVVCRRCKSR